MAGKQEKIQDEFLKMHEEAGGTYSGKAAETRQQAVNAMRDTAQSQYQAELSGRIAQKKQAARQQAASTGRTFTRNNIITGGQGIDLAKQTADRISPYGREVSAAQKEYDDYVGSPEYRQKQQQTLSGAATDEELQGALYKAKQDDTEKELKAKADYWKNQQLSARTSQIDTENLRKISLMPEEDQKALATYAQFFIDGDRDRIPLEDLKASESARERYGTETFKRLAETYSRQQNAARAEQAAQDARANVDTGPKAVLQNVLSVPGKLVSGVYGATGRLSEPLTRTGQYPTLAPVLSSDLPSIYYDAVREETGNKIVGEGDSKVRNVLGYGYQAGMSAADSLLRLVALGPNASLGAVAMDSFASGVREATQKGATPEQAYAIGAVNAGMEVLTEKVSMDKLLDIAKGKATKDLTKFLLNTIGQAGVEISEEEASLIGNTLAEAAILREKSEYNQIIQQLIVDGYSYADAKAAADKAIVDEAIETAIVSGLSGGMSGLAATVYSNAVTKAEAKASAAQQGAEATTADNTQQTANDMSNAQSPATQSPATPQADTAPTNALNDAIDTLKKTGNVSNKTVAKVLADPAAVQQLKEAGTDISQLATASEKRNAVKSAVRQLAGDGIPATMTREGADSFIADLGQALAEEGQKTTGNGQQTVNQNQQTTTQAEAAGVSPAVTRAIQATLGTTPVDTQTTQAYNGNNELQGGNDYAGTETAAAAVQAGAELHGTAGEGVRQVQSGAESYSDVQEGRNSGQRDIRISGELLLSDTATRALTDRGSPNVPMDSWTDAQAFKNALDEGRNSDVKNGWCVSPKEISDLTEPGVQMYLARNGEAGFVIKDGDIEAVFTNKAKGAPKGLADSLMLRALAAGGNKLDCYGEKLAQMYSQYGFEPVARVAFNETFANEGWSPDKGTPYIYVMKHNGDSVDTVAGKLGTYPDITKAQLDDLPTFGKNDYDKAMAYRDSLMSKASPQLTDTTKASPVQRQSGNGTSGSQGTDNAKPSVGAADRNFSGFEAYDNLLSDDNVQPRRASDAKNVEVPKTDAYGRDVSEFAHNAMNSDIISQRDIDTAKRLVQEGAFGHDTQKMADVRDTVYDEIQKKGVSASVREVSKAAASGKISEYDIAKAQALFAMLTDKKGVRAENMAGELLVDLGEMATQSGRQLNMFKLLRKLTPEGQISAVKSDINRYVDTLNQRRSAKNQVNVEIPTELEQDYIKAVRSGNETAQKQTLDQMYEYAAAQIPATLEEKFNSLRHLSMLGAPLTHIRNFGATGMFRPLSDIKRTISAGIQAVVLDQENRTAAVIGFGKESRELLSWAKADAKSDMAVSMMKGTYQNGDNARSEIEDKRTIFKNKALEGYREFNSNALEAEDMVWKKREYALTLASFLKARGYTADQAQSGAVPSKVMAEGRELAVKEALKSTFNDRNKFSDTISKFRKKGNDPWSRSLDVMAQGILPYTRTPANLAVRAVEYSPAGLAKAAYDLTEGVKSGKITAAQGIDNLASGLTGTGMMALGGALAAGIIPGVRLVGAKPDDDEDEENTQEYALEIGGLSIGISWLAPTNIPLFIGANLYNRIKASGGDGDVDPWDVMSAIVDSTTSSLDPVLELSCMSGLNDAIDNMKYEDTAGDKLLAMAYSAATGYFLQAVPTLWGRIEKGVEPNKMRTFSNAETTVQRSVERTLGGAFQKLPGDPFQIDKVDAYGNVVKDSGDPVTRLANALLNPFNVQRIDRSELTQEIKRLNGVQPDKVNMPSVPKTISYTDADGNHHDNERLTAEQYSSLEKTQKQAAAKLLRQVIGTDIYKAMTDDQKADVFSYVYDYAREKGRSEAIDGYPGITDSWMQDVDENGYGAIVEKVVTKGFSDAFNSMDTSALDGAYDLYAAMDKDRQKAFKEATGGRVGYYLTARENGVSTETFTKLYKEYKKLDDDNSMDTGDKANEWAHTLQKAKETKQITEKAKNALEDTMVFRYSGKAEASKFDAMTESGVAADIAYRVIKGLDNVKGTGSVDEDTGEAAVTNADKWDYIASVNGLSDEERDNVMKLYMTDYNPNSKNPDKTELRYDYLREHGYSAEQFVETYAVTRQTKAKREQIAAWQELGYSKSEAEMLYKLYSGRIKLTD